VPANPVSAPLTDFQGVEVPLVSVRVRVAVAAVRTNTKVPVVRVSGSAGPWKLPVPLTVQLGLCPV